MSATGIRLAGMIAFSWSALVAAAVTGAEDSKDDPLVRDRCGAIIRRDVSAKRLALLFTGDEFSESTAPILDALKAREIRGSFFVTGRFLRAGKNKPLVARIVAEGHYLGPHSDGHLLYASWEERDKSLVSRQEFTDDLTKNLAALKQAGALRKESAVYFVPPYEWYNRDQVRWSRAAGATLINFTPGSGSNRDYAPEGDRHFVPARLIYDDILAYEKEDPHGLNGFLLLLHLGSGRKDPFHPLLGRLCDKLRRRGYQFERVDELLKQSERAQ